MRQAAEIARRLVTARALDFAPLVLLALGLVVAVFIMVF